ncbi:hypothetical protein [Bradyrhizobium elkanii]|uniref:hypothetical protein n=1 Tax=Bradyrhizobium elkanii TaxID=29448 RepID=UPI0008421EF8|nr:hypothetical protein [Bradyrhizobium elkanii]ODM75059.1 hypothetical protein A6452_39085 [Bradyrhizobium elkanii]ODM82756.1 hypothetical protein A6X20_16680 [Bradyrhizobium elkanii]
MTSSSRDTKALAEPKLFSGTFSLGASSVEAAAIISINASGELVFEFQTIPYTAQSEFISAAWHGPSSNVVYFSFKAVADDGARFETDHLFFSSLGTASDESGARLTPEARCAKGTLRYALKEPFRLPALRMRIKGFRNFDSLDAECALGRLQMNGPHDRDDEDDAASGWIVVQAAEPPPDNASWRIESEKLLEHIRRIMSFATASLLRAPITEYIAGTESEVTVLSQTRQRSGVMPVFHFLDHDAIFAAAVRSYFSPPITVKRLFFAIEWFAMEGTYNEIRLVNAMTALENLIDSNIELSEALILPRAQFEKTRRVLLSVIKACLSKWAAAITEDASRELNEKLADLNRRSLLRKLELLAARWNVPLDGIDPASLKAAKQARDKVVHRGQYYEDAKDTDADLWAHVTVIREVAVRFLFTAIGYKGRYVSHVGGCHDAVFPPVSGTG